MELNEPDLEARGGIWLKIRKKKQSRRKSVYKHSDMKQDKASRNGSKSEGPERQPQEKVGHTELEEQAEARAQQAVQAM